MSIRFSSPLTHSDWMLHKGGPAWGREGVREMLEHCRDFGMKRIYWRVFDSGRAMYASDLVDPMNYNVHDEPYQYSPGYIPLPKDPEVLERLYATDYTNFDSFAAAVEIGHELGLEIFAWMTINEDDHGFGFTTRFSREHPEFRWTKRDGTVLHSQLSFAFKEVRDYKLALVKEMFRYDIDGIFLDWIRTGDIRDNPYNDADGVAEWGFEKPNIEAFEKQFGKSPYDVPNDDPDWLAVRALPITEFMRSVRKLTNTFRKDLPILTMVFHPWGYRGILPEDIRPNTQQWVINMKGHRINGSYKGLLCDIRTWSREKLVDEITAAGYYTKGGNAELAAKHLREETEGNLKIVLYMWVPSNADDVRNCLETAKAAGTDHILLWEADYIDYRSEPGRSEMMKAMREAILD